MDKPRQNDSKHREDLSIMHRIIYLDLGLLGTLATVPGTILNDQRVRRIPGSAMNVRSLYEPGKIHNVIQEMQRLDLSILGISDTRWPNSGQQSIANGTIYYSGSDDTHHRCGVAIVVSREINKSVINFTPISDRAMLLQLQTYHCKLNIIQTYAPTADKSDEDIEEFYNEINNIIHSLKSRDITLVLGDFNAKIGRGRFDKHVGEYGLGRRNERGDRLLQFFQENDYIISNTFFKLPNRHHRYRNVIKSVKTYPGADVSSDHNPLIAWFLITLKKQRVIPTTNCIDVSGLKIQETRQRLQNKINDNLRTLKNNQITAEEDTDKQWKDLKNALIEPSKTILTKQKIGKKQEWMTPEILNLMNERRGVKDNNEAYKNIQKEIRSQI
ncbi:craniofacial development protein 2-like [Cylas formicarius]|uniref:craniofacial development protein 2-like n=1 Tax=Cylas formicarius TaxID=197179 RepID=UPI0029586888|nr:craniofacial development protein 2-like [Cylas formicarius]